VSGTAPRPHIAAEIALVGVNAVAIVGLDRLFATTVPLRTTVPVLLLTHLILAFARRRHISAAVAAIASAATTVLIITWTLYANTRFLFLPSATTAEAVGADLDDAWFLFQDAVAPVDPLNGYIIATAIGAWLIAVLSDWEAFRSRSPIEAMIPALALIGYNGVLGPRTGDTAAIVQGAAFFVAAGLFVMLERMDRSAADTTWLAGQGARGVRHTITTGVLLLIPVVLVGALATPRLPGAASAPVIDVRGGGDGSTPRNAVSPLVDIQARLVNQSDVELFRVTSDTPSYWRLMALDLFENDRWRLERGFDEAAGELPRSEDAVDSATAMASQTFTVTSLADDWVPAAFDPIAADSGLDLLFDPVSSTLLLADEQDDLTGVSYGITSRIPQPDRATAEAAARQPIPADITARFTQLPSDFSPEVARIAREVTDGAQSPYEQSLALQNWLRTFTYDVDVAAGHSFNRIEDFLALQRGYCEQFATSFGAMARSLGIPARVAVGFTTGDPTGNPGEYIVRGRHAHAWPEVYLAGVGWTHFEPTPGRGNPASTSINSIEGAQDLSPGAAEVGTTPTTVPTTTAPSTGQAQPPVQPFQDAPAVDAGSAETSGAGWLTTVALLLGGLLTCGVLYVAALWWVRRHGHQRLLSEDPPVRVAKAWQRADRDLRLAGVPSRPAETHLEFSDRVHASLGEVGPELDRLTTLHVEAAYAPPDRVDDEHAAAAESASAHLRTALHQGFPRGLRLRTWVDPRLPGPPPPTR
jgi:transglutaminase-like putative cysteine protease